MELQESRCACKGVRSCLFCEKCKQTGAPQIRRPLTFTYNQRTKRAEFLQKNGTAIYFQFPGVEIIENFISKKEEEEMASQIDANPWKNSQSGRRKQDYGPKVNFKKKKIRSDVFCGLPAYSKAIVERMCCMPDLDDFQPVEQCNLEYVPERGSAIDPHFDDHWLWGERLITLNLLSQTFLTMTWSGHISKAPALCGVNLQGTSLEDIAVKIRLDGRSLIVLSGEARDQWMHGIERNDITNRRLCCTFRELSNEFLYGARKEEGLKLLSIASSFNGAVVP